MRSGTMRTSATARRPTDKSARAPRRFRVDHGSTPPVAVSASSREAATPSVRPGFVSARNSARTPSTSLRSFRGTRPLRCRADLPGVPRPCRPDHADQVADDPAVHPIQAMRPALHSPCSTDVATCGRLSRDSVTALGYGTTSAGSGAIPSQGRTGATRRMTNASVANSASSTPWHAVFAGYGDLEEATTSGSQVRVCEASLATALDQRDEMTSHRALRRSCWCRPVVYQARPSTVGTPVG